MLNGVHIKYYKNLVMPNIINNVDHKSYKIVKISPTWTFMPDLNLGSGS